jgi:DHA2 family multidrug resistance protein
MVYEIGRQAQMLAFNDIFWFIAMVTLAIIPLIFLMKKPEKVSLVPPVASETAAETMR